MQVRLTQRRKTIAKSKSKKQQKYLVQLTVLVEVETSYEIEASSEDEARNQAEELFEDNINIAKLPKSGDISVSVDSFVDATVEKIDE